MVVNVAESGFPTGFENIGGEEGGGGSSKFDRGGGLQSIHGVT